MTDNSQNFDSLQERNQQVLNNISQLQTQEKELYASLDDVSLSSDQKQQIINKINEISQMRLNLYSGLKDMYSSYQQNVASSRTTLGQSVAAVNVLENELNQAKIRLNLLEDEKYNKLRLVEINTYFGKRYNAHSKVMKIIVYTCIPIIILAILANKQILPSNLYKLLVVIVLVIGLIFLGNELIDLSNRDDMNWDEYNWYFDQSQAPSDKTEGTPSDPWATPSITCVGQACCYDGSTYDSTQNICLPNSIYQQTNSDNTNQVANTNENTNGNTNEDITETFKGLGKYGYSQLKAFSINNTISPLNASFSSFL